MQGFIIKQIPQKHLYRSQDKRYLILNYVIVAKWVIFNGKVAKVTRFIVVVVVVVVPAYYPALINVCTVRGADSAPCILHTLIRTG
jgi:hypothetical protein